MISTQVWTSESKSHGKQFQDVEDDVKRQNFEQFDLGWFVLRFSELKFNRADVPINSRNQYVYILLILK